MFYVFLQSVDARIIIGNFDEKMARLVFCHVSILVIANFSQFIITLVCVKIQVAIGNKLLPDDIGLRPLNRAF